MAKNVKKDKVDSLASNATFVKKALLTAHNKLLELEANKDAISEQMREVRATVKAVGIKAKDFEAARRYAKLEAEDKNEAVTNLQVCFEALGVAPQGELFGDYDQAAEAPAEEPPADKAEGK